jgi:hypothetical protein
MQVFIKICGWRKRPLKVALWEPRSLDIRLGTEVD